MFFKEIFSWKVRRLRALRQSQARMHDHAKSTIAENFIKNFVHPNLAALYKLELKFLRPSRRTSTYLFRVSFNYLRNIRGGSHHSILDVGRYYLLYMLIHRSL